MKIPFGKPFPAIDTTSLRDGAAAGLTNGYINELDDYQMVPGHTLFGTHGGATPLDTLYETLEGYVLTVTNGVVNLVQSDGTFTAFSGATVTPDRFYYWAEDGQHVYLAHGGKLARLDMAGLTVTLLNENTPNAVTHVCRTKGYLLCNGNDVIIGSTPFALAQVFDEVETFYDAVALYDFVGYMLMGGGGETQTALDAGLIYMSKDNGLSWVRTYTGSGLNMIFALCYMGAGVVLAGDSAGHVLRSIDYGVTWADIGQLGVQTSINVIEKIDTDIAIAGGAGGVGYRTIDGGATWTAISTPSDFGSGISSAIVWSSSVVTLNTYITGFFVDSTTHVWRSTDGGVTFTEVQALDNNAQIVSGVKVSASIGLVALQLAIGPPAAGKLYRTTDAGVTWTDIGDIGLEDGELPSVLLLTSTGELLFASVFDALALYAANSRLWKSTDLGVTWAFVREFDPDEREGAISVVQDLVETHTAGQLLVAGTSHITLEANSSIASKWQTGTGRTAPVGDIFYSEDIANNYQAVDSWERFSAQACPDAATGVFENRALVYACGPRSVEINFNSVDPAFPWQVSDPSLPFGLGAPNSWVNYDDLNTVMYLSCTDKVWEVVKFQGRSQHSISQVYAAVLNDRTIVTAPETAKAWGVVMRGIPFYVLSFQDDNLTICYNLLKDHWFRWAFWTGTEYEAAIINSYVYSKTLNKHLVGDRRSNGRLYELGGTSDNGEDMRMELVSGHIKAGSFSPKTVGRMIFKLKRGDVSDASEPHICWSPRDNGNRLFGNARPVSLGLMDNTEFFGWLNRCGMYHTRQHKLVYVGTKTDIIISDVDES